ncbi:hypothetical protein MYP_2427 [Sporocytophaga myxococcoides]|uniref:Uncharacterized protein n=1 Tax=Sporocytophaga myxococcoides TaxID=153721 RepID=A0A098LGI3_9BACT|nr:hypothetical protein [Sporocytophaga myxococcoides]GAL85198.1 hypothetical protein MYP_2427 [Sporocytophaga myxococcoides]
MDKQNKFIIREIVREKSELGPGHILFEFDNKLSAEKKFNELCILKVRESKLYDLLLTLSDERILMINEYFTDQFGKALVKEHPDGDIEYLFDTLEFQIPQSATDKQVLELINKGKIKTHLLLEFEGPPPLYTVEKNPDITFYNSGKVFRMPDSATKWYYHSENEARENTIKLFELAISSYALKRIELNDLKACDWDQLSSLRKDSLVDFDANLGVIYINERLNREETRLLIFAINPKPFLIRQTTLEEEKADHLK